MPYTSKKHGFKKVGASLGDLTPQEAIDDIGGTDESELPDGGKNHNPGRAFYKRELEAFALLTNDEKLDALRETWKEVAMGAATRAKTFVATCSNKEFASLQKLIAAAATGIETAFPKSHDAPNTQFIINMFGSLGQRAAAIASPPVPTITVEATEVPWPSSDSMNETTSLLKTKTETSTTTMPSPVSSSTPSPQ